MSGSFETVYNDSLLLTSDRGHTLSLASSLLICDILCNIFFLSGRGGVTSCPCHPLLYPPLRMVAAPSPSLALIRFGARFGRLVQQLFQVDNF